VNTINQVMDDGIMTLFGVSVAHESHAVQVGDAEQRCAARD
jgi:hypothetical protein